jgi:hypothetical protein
MEVRCYFFVLGHNAIENMRDNHLVVVDWPKDK